MDSQLERHRISIRRSADALPNRDRYWCSCGLNMEKEIAEELGDLGIRIERWIDRWRGYGGDGHCGRLSC